ncbi:MAG TPA: MscL family protein [Streptosporangiaceae bacterium]|nr:MscL family protein [Streptosporangiaceae bacterium]
MSGFKNFITRGNLVQLAVAVVIGTQFSDLVKQFVTSFISPLLSLTGVPSASSAAYPHGVRPRWPARRDARPARRLGARIPR